MELNAITTEVERDIDWVSKRLNELEDNRAIIDAMKAAESIEQRERILTLVATPWLESPAPDNAPVMASALNATAYNGTIQLTHQVLLSMIISPSVREQFMYALLAHIVRYGADPEVYRPTKRKTVKVL